VSAEQSIIVILVSLKGLRQVLAQERRGLDVWEALTDVRSTVFHCQLVELGPG
jgi:hypothetical protein